MENHVLIQNVTSDEFFERVKEAVRDELKNLINKSEAEEQKLLTRNETSKHLRVSLPTLNTYTKNGLIKSVRFGYRVLYRLEDVLVAVQEISTRRI